MSAITQQFLLILVETFDLFFEVAHQLIELIDLKQFGLEGVCSA